MQMIFVMGLVLVKGQVILVMSIYELTLSLAFLLPYENNIVVLYFLSADMYCFVCGHPFQNSKLQYLYVLYGWILSLWKELIWS